MRCGSDLAPCPPPWIAGASAAGHAFDGQVGAGEAVRIFTGAPVPAGRGLCRHPGERRRGGRLGAKSAKSTLRTHPGARRRFHRGDILLRAGKRLTATGSDAGGANELPFPSSLPPPAGRVLASGDELVPPGRQVAAQPDHLVHSLRARRDAAAAGAEAGCSASPGTRRKALASTSPPPRAPIFW